MDNFDPYNVLLAIATNIPQRLKTGFVLQNHQYSTLFLFLLSEIYIRGVSVKFSVI